MVDFESSGADLERALEADGMLPVTAHNRNEVLDHWAERPPDAVLLSVDPKAERHREIVRIVRAAPEGHVPILFYGPASEGAPIRAPSEALAQGGDYFFRLPCDLSYLAGRARAWAERGAKQPEATAPSAPLSREAPQLEGFESGDAVDSPILERLRVPAALDAASAADWQWVGELDRSEILDPMELELPEVSGDAASPTLDLSDLTPSSAPEASPARKPTTFEVAGVGRAERDALLSAEIDDPEDDPLEELRIEEAEELPVAPVTSGPPTRISPDPQTPVWMGDESIFEAPAPPPVEEDEPIELAVEPAMPEPQVAPEPPKPRFEVHPPPTFDAARPPSYTPAPNPVPAEVSFPTIDITTESRVVAGRSKPDSSRISPETLEALRKLLTDNPPRGARAEPRAEPPRPEMRAEPIAPAVEAEALVGEEDPFDVYEPTLTLMPEERAAWVERLASPTSEACEPPAPVTAESIEEPPEPVKVTLTESPPPRHPITEDEETQELFMAPVAATTTADDFPPGALAIVSQAERQRQRGAIEEACAGYALAAQVYLDHDLVEPAKSLYRQVLALDPVHPFAKARLANLEGSGGASRDDIVLEFEDDVPSSEVTSDLHLEVAGKDASRPSTNLHGDLDLDEVEAPAFVLGRLQPASLSPERGRVTGVADMVQLLLRARAQRSTGTIDLGEAVRLQIAHGVPSGLIGDAVVPSFLRLVADVGRIGEGQARELAQVGGLSPRALARRLAARGLIDVEEEILLPTRHLEDQLVRFLQHRGEWIFEASIHAATQDLVPRVGELREWLVELLPRATTSDELRRALDLGQRTVRIVPGTDHFVATPDVPLVNLLDGRRGLEEAARLAGTPLARALGWALVWLQEGLAEVVERQEARERPRTNRSAAPLRNLPPLQPKPEANRPSFRLDRKPMDSRPLANSTQRRLSGLTVGATMSGASTARSDDGPNTGRVEMEREEVLAGLDDEARVHAMAEMVRTEDYFGILDVDAGASRKAIDEAHRRVRELVPEDVDAGLEAMVREVLRSVDEARDVLMIPELRAAYEHHLEPQA